MEGKDKEIEKLKADLERIKKNRDTYDLDQRVVLNTPFKIFEAMNNKDYDYLDSIVTENVTIDRKTNQIITDMKPAPAEYSLFTDFSFGDLDYRAIGVVGDDATFHFAEYFSDGHASFSMTFVRDGYEWKLDGFVDT